MGLKYQVVFPYKSYSAATVFIVFLCCCFSVRLTAQQGRSCATAINLNLPFTITSYNTCGNGNNYAGQNGCSPIGSTNPYAGQDVFFRFTPTQNGYLTLQLHGVRGTGNVQPRLFLFRGCPGAGGICANVLEGNTNVNGTSVILSVFENITYYIVVDAAMTQSPTSASCFTFNMLGSFIPVPTEPGCTNMDFSTGDISGWVATTGRSIETPRGSPTADYRITGVGVANNRHTIVTDGLDPCGGFPRLDPLGSPYSLRIGNNSPGGQGEQVSQTFIVTQENSSLTYRYAVVFEDPNHPSHQQPFFRAIVKDSEGNSVTCSDFIVSASGNLPGFFNSSTCRSVRYKPWSTVNVDLSLYAGQTITVEFTTGDCTPGGHYGYAYVDAFCTPSTLNALGDTICIGDSVSMAAPDGYSSYVWLPMNDSSQAITVRPTETTVYTLELTAFNGCKSTFDIPIVVTNPPQVSFTYEPDNCDFPVQFTETGTVNVGSLASQWDFGSIADPSGSNSSNPSALFPGPGTYPVKLVQTTAGGCVDSTIQNITVPDCFFQIRMENDTLCAGECHTIEVSKHHGLRPFQYQWSTGETDSTLTVCPSATTVYHLTVTDSRGDTYTDSVQITISPTVVFDSLVKHISCFGANDGSIEPNPQGFGPFVALWSNDSTSLNIDSLVPGNYTLTLTDPFGCVSTGTFTIIEPDTLHADIVLTEPTCNTNTGIIEVVNLTGGTPGFRYGLDNGIFGLSGLFENMPVGNYTVVVQDTNGCEKRFPVSLQNATAPQSVDLQLEHADCDQANGMIRILGINGGFAPYSYALDSAAAVEINAFPVVISDLEGIGYRLTLTDSNNCYIDSTVSLLQAGAPEAIFTQVTHTTCGMDNGSVEVSIEGGVAPLTYSINHSAFISANTFDRLTPGVYHIVAKDDNRCTIGADVEIEPSDGVTVQINLVSDIACHNDATGALTAEIAGGASPYRIEWSSGENRDELYDLSAGDYSVTVTDDDGCEAMANISLENPDPLGISITGPDYVCAGEPATLQAIFSGTQGTVEIDWMDGFSAAESITLVPDVSTWVTVDITDEAGCQGSAGHFILLRELPRAEILTDTGSGCVPICANFTLDIQSSDSLRSIVWESTTGAVYEGNFMKLCYEESGLYGAGVLMTDIYNCSNSFRNDSLVHAYVVPVALFSFDPRETTILQPEIRFYQESTDADFYRWTFGDGNGSEEPEPVHIYQDTGSFRICLEVSTAYTCYDSICGMLQVDPFPTAFAPNTFTPNKDGLNDVFRIYSTYLTRFRLEIFNRWGELVFVSEDPEKGWDGTLNGQPAPEGIYVWQVEMIDIFKETRKMKGKVSLVR